MATAAVSLGYGQWARLASGAGVCAWLGIESVLLPASILARPCRRPCARPSWAR